MAVCPTTAVTLCGEMSSNSGLCAGIPFCAVGCTFCSDKFDSTETVKNQEKTYDYYFGKIKTEMKLYQFLIIVQVNNLRKEENEKYRELDNTFLHIFFQFFISMRQIKNQK